MDDNDYQLGAGSPCIDAGDSLAVLADLPDLDGDGNVSEPLSRDLSDKARILDDPATVDTGIGNPLVVDMGAYEFGEADECLGDLDGSGAVDFSDLLAMFGLWGPCPAPCAGDLADPVDGVVDFNDLLALFSVWGQCP